MILARLLRVVFGPMGRLAPRLTARIAWLLFCTPSPPRPPSARATRVLATGRQLEVVSDGVALAGWLWSDAQAGGRRPVVLLVHGWGGRTSDFAALVGPLRDAGFDVAALDAPAHGASPGARTNLPAYGRALLALVDQMEREGRVVQAVLGHSFGALVSVYTVTGGPSLARGIDTVRRIALVSSPDRVDGMSATFAQMIGLPESARQAMHARLERVAGAPIEAFATGRFLADWGGRALVVHDRDDREVRFEEGEAIAAEGRATFHATSGLGHRRILRSPEVAARLAAFLADAECVSRDMPRPAAA